MKTLIYLSLIAICCGIKIYDSVDLFVDNSGRWVTSGNVQTVSGTYQAWLSEDYFFEVQANAYDGTLTLLSSVAIPTEYKPRVAYITGVGLDGEYIKILMVTKGNPSKLIEVKVSTQTSQWAVVNQVTIPGIQGTPNWQLIISEEPSVSPSILFLFAVDFVLSFDYPNFEFVKYVNVTENVENIFPIAGVSGAAVSELDNELYMARYGTAPTEPGQMILFRLIDYAGNFQIKFPTYLDSSPNNFEVSTSSTPSKIFWTQSESGEGDVYRWVLQQGDLKSASVSFSSGEFFSPMKVMNMAQTNMLYASGPLTSGYKLHKFDMTYVSFVDSLTVHNDTVPQLGLGDVGSTDGYAVLGTVTTDNYMKLLYVYFGS